MRFTVEYNPTLSKHAERLIRAEITASMISHDKRSSQYPIDFCIKELEKENQDGVFKHDISYLRIISEENVTYIEI
jgi:hypothetical protein